jgi:hypothetical protein
MKQLLALSKILQNNKLHNERFRLSLLLAKLAAEQLELFPEEEYQYKCVKCDGVFTSDMVDTFDTDDLTKYQVEMTYEIEGLSEYPICDACQQDLEDHCALCGTQYGDDTVAISRDTLHDADALSALEYQLENDEYPVCYDCLDEYIYFYCANCEEHIIKGHQDEVYVEGEGTVCETCYEQNYLMCESCEAMFHRENESYRIINDEIFCEDCTPSNVNNNYSLQQGIGRALPKDDFVNLVLSRETISKIKNLVEPMARKHRNKDIVPPKQAKHFKSFIQKMRIEDTEKEAVLKFIERFGADNEWQLDVGKLLKLNDYIQGIEAKDRAFADKYDTKTKRKRTKGYTPMSVSYSVRDPRDGALFRSFVVVMKPSEDMLEAASRLFGREGGWAWKMLSESGYSAGLIHFNGAIAYARISNHDGDWIIDNLQCDADSAAWRKTMKHEAYKKNILDTCETFNLDLEDIEEAAKWWLNKTKHWSMQFLLDLQKIAEESVSKLYLTTFDTQLEKWTSIPDKNLTVYDEIPRELSQMRQNAVPEEEKENVYPQLLDEYGQTEEGDGYELEYDKIWRIARRKDVLKKILYT